MKIKPILREIADRTRAREDKYAEETFLIALIPALIFTIVVVNYTHNWDLSLIIVVPFAIVGLYLISIMAILDIFFGRSIYEVLSPRFVVKLIRMKHKINRHFNMPNRLDELEQKVKSQNTLLNSPNLTKALNEVAETYENLGNKKLPEIITKLHQDNAEIKKELAIIKDTLKINKYPCSNPTCQRFFEAKGPDDVFTIAMREKCDYCDILNMTMFRRKSYICDYCGETNYIFWHHKDGHTNDEVRLAEKKFDE